MIQNMKKETSIFNEKDMFWCSVPVPPINNHKDDIFDFLPEQITNYGQSQTHPSIVYIPGGWNGHEYWLATTPYPNSTGVFENTCIYYGDADPDGTPPRLFHPINGTANGIYTRIQNPITPVPDNATVNSDPDLFFDNNTLWLISRENTNSFATYSQKSIDGQSWTPRGARDTGFLWRTGSGVLTGKPEFLSPALIRVSPSKLRAYCLSGSAGIYPRNIITNTGVCWGIWIMEGTTLEGPGDFVYTKKATLTGKRDIEPWHFDVFHDDETGFYYAICSGNNYNSNGVNGVYLAESTDGLTFNMFSKPIIDAVPQYRPTAFIDSNRNFVLYWCSEAGAPTDSGKYPRGASDIPVDGRAIGVSFRNFDDMLSELRFYVIGWQ